MDKMDNVLTFTAIRGVQAGREYYSAMCPLKVIPRIFLYDEEEISAELRSQRTLNRTRVPEIARYIVENPQAYIFSSITASVDGEVNFQPHGEEGTARNVGQLLISMTSRFLINDGQHRRAAIEEALKQCPELGEETLSVVFFVDAGLKRSQQMFADLNRHAIRPTKSLGILYDHRDPLSQLARTLAEKVNIFHNLTELEKTTISNRSNKLYTLSSIYQATQSLLRKTKQCKITKGDERLALAFWDVAGNLMGDWKLAAEKKVSCAELRRDYIHAHGLALQAIGIAGASLIAAEPQRWKTKLKPLQQIDWSRSNTKVWEGRALVSGRVSKALVHVTRTANLVKKKLGLSLTPKEQESERDFLKERSGAA
jgi:DNA sulfur modification protein DndB